MSKLTSQEVIAKGEYLDPLFDPSSLLVAHLRSILQHHSVRFPTNANKSQLIQLFKENIRAKSKELRRERDVLDGTASDASEIIDAETGEPIQQAPVAKKSARRLPRTSTAAAHASSPPSKHSKARRLSKKPVVEVSDSDSESGSNSDRTPQRILPLQKPRSSLWEDNNPFQSGRDSLSAPRRSITPRNKTPRASLSQRKISLDRQTIQQSSPVNQVDAASEYSVQEGELEADSEFDEIIPEELLQAREVEYENQLVSNRLSGKVVDPRKSLAIMDKDNFPLPKWVRILLGLITILALGPLVSYKSESKGLGFCEAGTNSNSQVQRQLATLQDIQHCHAKMRNATDVHEIQDSHCTWSSLLPLPHPTDCTPCPANAKCSPTTLLCESAYTLKPHPLASVPLLSWLCDGLPLFGPVAFPPRCIPDSRRRRAIGVTAKKIESLLARFKGQQMCNAPLNQLVSEETAYGLTREELHIQAQKFKPSRDINNFDDVFDQALAELKSSGLVVQVLDTAKNTLVLAAIRFEMDFGCKAKVLLKSYWYRWRMQILYSLLSVISLFAVRSRWTTQALEARRVKALVEEALKMLQAQEAAHYIDPVQNPSPSLSSLQLRDLIMQNEHSIPKRARIWQKVERVVEGNTNVRVNMEVMSTGDEGRMWTWIGGHDRRVNFINDSNGRPVV